MNSDKKRRRLASLNKRYLSMMRKITEQKRRILVLKNSNNELTKVVIQLREDVQKFSLKNTNLKAELCDLASDKNSLRIKSRKVYETLSSIKKYAVNINTRLDSILTDSKFAEISRDDRLSNFTPPVVNGQVIKNPKETLLSTINYPRYNFRDCIYVQDLSPILEENAEIPDITRRLGQRAKIRQPCLSLPKLEENGTLYCEAIVNVNHVNNSPSTSEKLVLRKSSKTSNEDINFIVPEASVNRFTNSPSSANDSCIPKSKMVESSMNQLSASFTSGKQSTLNIHDPSMVNINQSVIGEVSHDNSDLHPSIFVNVFPRRKKQNEFGDSLLEENGDQDSTKELNRMEISSTPSQNSLYQSSSEMIVTNSSVKYLSIEKEDSGFSLAQSKNSMDEDKSETGSPPPLINNSTDCRREQEKSSSLSFSFNSIIEGSIAAGQAGVDLLEIGKNIKKKSKSASKSYQSGYSTTIEVSKGDIVNNDEETLVSPGKRRSLRSASESSPPKRSSVTSKANRKDESLVSRKNSDKSFSLSQKNDVSNRKSRLVKEKISAVSIKSLQKVSLNSLKNDCSIEENSSNFSKDLPKDNICESSSKTTSGRRKSKENVSLNVGRKALRNKKPISFVESPIENDKKRKRRKKKMIDL